MPLQLQVYDVSVARDGLDLAKALEAGPGDGYDTHRVTIMHADSLVAEQAGPRYGLGELKAAPLAYTTLWCWAALRRLGVSVPEFPLFKAQVLDVTPVKKPGATGETGDVVDPTTLPPDTGSP